MILLLMILALVAFFQASIFSTDLLVVFLIVRSFLVRHNVNYYLAFGLGVLVSILTSQPIGIMSIIYILVVKIVYTLRSTALSSYWFSLMPIGVGVLSLVSIANRFILNQPYLWTEVIIQSFLIIPMYITLLFWEERFIGRPTSRLQIKL